jgi:uncharacterized surface protein with fasciclin (FAS1) repeats
VQLWLFAQNAGPDDLVEAIWGYNAFNGEFSVLTALVDALDLESDLRKVVSVPSVEELLQRARNGEDLYEMEKLVFFLAPTDTAFRRLGITQATLPSLLSALATNDEARDVLRAIIMYHVVIPEMWFQSLESLGAGNYSTLG